MKTTNRVWLLSDPRGSPSEFVSILPQPVPITRWKNWEVCLNSVAFLPLFLNLPEFEEGGEPHMYAFHCKNIAEAMNLLEVGEDGAPTGDFPSEDLLKKHFWVKETRLSARNRLDGLENLMEVLNNLFSWEDQWVGPGPCEPRIRFTLGIKGVRIEGDGEVVALISKMVVDWLGIEYHEASIVSFGNHQGKYLVFDSSAGKRRSVEGRKKLSLLQEAKPPSRITIQACFDPGSWRSKRLATIPYANHRVQHCGKIDPVRPTFIYHVKKLREYVTDHSEGGGVSRVKISLMDEKGRLLQLAENTTPTQICLSFRETRATMVGFPARVNGGSDLNGVPDNQFRLYFNPRLNNASGRWHVALHSVFIPAAIKCVSDDKDGGTRLDFKLADGQRWAIPSLRAEWFESPTLLLRKLAELITQTTRGDAKLVLDIFNKVRIELAPGVEVTMQKKLAIILGLVTLATDPTRPLKISSTITAVDSVDLGRLFPSTVRVHCDAVEKSILGNDMSDVLSIIPTHQRSGGLGELIVHESSKLEFIKIRGDHLSNTLFSLRTVDGALLPFASCNERVHVNLIFSQK